MSPFSGDQISCQAVISVYDGNGNQLDSAKIDTIKPMGSRLIYFDELFGNYSAMLIKHEHLGVIFSGKNLVEPFSVEFSATGDFHIHHIN